jgi:toxin ParE1/3/4
LILQWLPKALANRDTQIVYIAQDNPLAAITQGDLITTQDQLIEQPGMGRIGRKRDTRELVISKTPFVVIFRVKAKRIEIIRLLHGSQQNPAS